MKQNEIWVPRGVVITGLLLSEHSKPRQSIINAAAIWGRMELTKARALGADTLRFQVSQPALDHLGGNFDASYITKVTTAVSEARSDGFNVIISMQWQPSTGISGQYKMPTLENIQGSLSSTVRAWKFLAPYFKNDDGIMFELFNEPCMRINAPNAWEDWRSGHQAVIEAVRETNAHNVLLVDGLQCGKSFQNAPELIDPEQQLAYAVHPYPGKEEWQVQVELFTDSDFDKNFGFLVAKGYPVLITEWALGYGNCHDGLDGYPTSPQLAETLLDYAKKKKIGVVGWALDIPGTIFDKNLSDLTNLKPFKGCRGQTRNFGFGATLRAYFLNGTVAPQ